MAYPLGFRYLLLGNLPQGLTVGSVQDIGFGLQGQWDIRVRITARDGNTYRMERRLWLK